MPAYFIYARSAIIDEEKAKRYSELVVPQIREFGGELPAACATPRVFEGEWDPMTVTVSKFEDMGSLMARYDSEQYALLEQMRLESSTGDVIIIEGG